MRADREEQNGLSAKQNKNGDLVVSCTFRIEPYKLYVLIVSRWSARLCLMHINDSEYRKNAVFLCIHTNVVIPNGNGHAMRVAVLA